MTSPSLNDKLEAAGNAFARVLCGLVIFLFGGILDLLEYKVPPTHTSHIAGYTLIAFIGILVMAGRFVFPVIQQFIVIVGPYIPVVGGRRSGDPPAAP